MIHQQNKQETGHTNLTITTKIKESDQIWLHQQREHIRLPAYPSGAQTTFPEWNKIA
jgi:hypothetical protein